MKLCYSSNNSGGSWWLKDEDWFALEGAGWSVDWYDPEEEYDYPGATPGSKRYPGDRFIGALASDAHKYVGSKEEAMEAVEEFETLTGQSANDEGCNCCGRPHYFSLYDEISCDHYDNWQKIQYSLEDCLWCEGTGIKEEYVASFDSEPIITDYKRGF